MTVPAIADNRGATMVAGGPHYGTLTLLFADIEGSTRLAQRLGDERWLDVIETYRLVVAQQVTAFAGLCLRTWGDGVMAAFADPASAQRGAVAMQRGLLRHVARHPEAAFAVRIGVHTGRVIRVGGDFYGLHVNLAARVADAAGGGEILVSASARARTAGGGGLRYGPARTLQLKGVAELQRAFPLDWRAGPRSVPSVPDAVPALAGHHR